MLICKICGKSFKSNLSRHICVHGITKEEYLATYPNSKMVSDEYSATRSDISKNIFDDAHRENQRKNLENQRKNTNFQDIQREAVKNMWNDEEFRKKKNQISSKNFTKQNIENWKNQEYRKEKSIAQSALANSQWKDESFREKMIPIIMSNICSKNNIQEFDYKGIHCKFRSILEKDIITKLIDENVPYEYESLKIRYYDTNTNKHRTYIPDIYIPQLNLIAEIKPKTLIDDSVVIDKKNACIDLGYDYMFITSKTDVYNIISRFNDYRNHST